MAKAIDLQKLGLTMFLGSCIVIAGYLVSIRDSSGCDLAFRVQNSAETNSTTANDLQHSETKSGTVDVAGKESKEEESKDRDHKEQKIEIIQPAETKTEEAPKKEVVEKISKESSPHDQKEDHKPEPKKPDAKTLCDFSHHRVEVCEMHGDVRIHGKSKSLVYVTNEFAIDQWKIRPHTIKTLPVIPQVSINVTGDAAGAPRCTVNHSVPAIIFSDGGFTGNFWHDFADVIVPLFATAKQFGGEVQLLLQQYMYWFVDYKYRTIIKKLSKYDVIDFDNDDEVRCFPGAIVSLYFHEILSIYPNRTPGGVSTADFMKFLRETYSLKRDVAVNLSETPEKKPRLLIMARKGTRSFRNVEEIVKGAEEVGFEAVADDVSVPVNLTEFPKKDARLWANVSEIARVMNGFDALVGVHGAGLTNFLFMPSSSVLIQVVPWGPLDVIARNEFGEGAESAGVKYLQHKIGVEESTLSEIYPEGHKVLTNPHGFPWQDLTRIFLREQHVKLNVTRFKTVLQKAMQLLHR